VSSRSDTRSSKIQKRKDVGGREAVIMKGARGTCLTTENGEEKDLTTMLINVVVLCFRVHAFLLWRSDLVAIFTLLVVMFLSCSSRC